MKTAMFALALTMLGSAASVAQTTIIERSEPPAVVIERREAPVVIEKRSVESTTGCNSTTVHRENDRGESTTVRKENC